MPWMWRSRDVWGRGVALVAAVLVLLSGGASILPNGQVTGFPNYPTGVAVVTGGIIPCAGIPDPNGPYYAAGTVTVLGGQVTWQNNGQGYLADVLPTRVVARERVAMNGTYLFVLEPGQYVLEAQFPPPSNVLPYTVVTVSAGDNLSVDIPNMCL
jgi:hypothetical protein